MPPSNLARQSIDRAGSLPYLAPEVLRGEAVDPRCDLFSLGVLLYEMVAGRRPFEAAQPAALVREILEAEPRPVGAFRENVPLELESVLRSALEKRPDDRYVNAAAMLSDLRGVLASLENVAGLRTWGAPPSPEEEFEPVRAESILVRVWEQNLAPLLLRFRRWIAVAGTLTALSAALDFTLRSPRGAHVGTDVALVILALALLGAARLSRSYRMRQPLESKPGGAAFRGLLPFQEIDRDRFYGRELDTAALFDMVTHGEFRFGVLFGDSGCGKTSLLRAGLVPGLWDHGYVPIYCRTYKDPLATVIGECSKHTREAPADGGEPPIEYLKRVAGQAGLGMIIVLGSV